MWPPRYIGKILQTSYAVTGLFKHDAWNEFGPGHSINFPIQVEINPALYQQIPQQQVPQQQTPQWKVENYQAIHLLIIY